MGWTLLPSCVYIKCLLKLDTDYLHISDASVLTIVVTRSVYRQGLISMAAS